MNVSKETLELALQCVEGAAFTITSAELQEVAARVASATYELKQAIEDVSPQV